MDSQEKEQKKKEEMEKLEEDLFITRGSRKKKTGILDCVVIWSIIIGFTILVFFIQVKSENIKYGTNYATSYLEYLNAINLDYEVNSNDIKNQIKRLEIIWNPENNQGCKEICEKKFQEIQNIKAYLTDDSNSRSYEKNKNSIEKMQSKAFQLDENNFQKLVQESNDVWILELYDDGDHFCQQMNIFWENAYQELRSIVKFGKINRKHDYGALKFISINLPVVPTTINYHYEYESQLYVLNRENPAGSLNRFISDSIKQKVKIVESKELDQLPKSVQQFSESKREIDVIYLGQVSKLPIQYKYTAFKYYPSVNFYATKSKDFSHTRQLFKIKGANNNLLIYYNDYLKKSRERIELEVGKEWDQDKFAKIINYIKFASIPSINRNNFRDYCINTKLKDVPEMIDEDIKSNKLQNMCILQFSNNGTVDQLQQIHTILNNIVLEQYKKSEQFQFDMFNAVQVGVVESDLHFKFFKLIQKIYEEKFNSSLNLSTPFAMLPENNKIYFFKNQENLEDELFDLFDGIRQFSYYDYEPDQLPQLFKYQNQDTLSLITTEFYQHFKDWKMFLSFIIIILSLWIYKYQLIYSILMGMIFYLFGTLALTAPTIFQEYFR